MKKLQKQARPSGDGFIKNSYKVQANEIRNIANSGNVQIGDLIYFSDGGTEDIYHAAIIVRIENGEIYYMQNSGPKGEQRASEKTNKNMYIIALKDANGGYENYGNVV